MTADAVPPNPPYATPPQPPQPAASNGLGMAGFIVSLVGLVLTCGLLCPVGLVLSLFGLRKEPRGFAIAGAVIGGIGSIFALLMGFAIVVAVLGVKEAVKEGSGPLQTVFAMTEAKQAIDMDRAENGRLPTDVKGNELIAELRDGWKRALRYERHEDSFTIRCAGADGVFGNADDETVDGR